MTAKTSTEKSRELRKRRTALGLTRLDIYAHPLNHPAIKRFSAELEAKRIDGGEKMVSLTNAELNLVREWFDIAQDFNPAYLEKKDFVLAKRLYEALGFRVTSKIINGTKIG